MPHTNTNPAGNGNGDDGARQGLSFDQNKPASNSLAAPRDASRHREQNDGTEPARDRDWWRAEAHRVGSDWSDLLARYGAVLAGYGAIITAWRERHDPNYAGEPITACPSCAPCRASAKHKGPELSTSKSGSCRRVFSFGSCAAIAICVTHRTQPSQLRRDAASRSR
jgi:hypothetical protein